MRFHLLSQRLVAGAILVLLLSGCGPNDVGQYSEAKQDWDSPRAEVQLDQMRLRTMLTQQDH